MGLGDAAAGRIPGDLGGVLSRGGVPTGDPTLAGITVLMGERGEASRSGVGAAQAGLPWPLGAFKPVWLTCGFIVLSCSATDPKS